MEGLFFKLLLFLSASTLVRTDRQTLRIGALLSIYNDQFNTTSANVDIDSVKNLEAILWVFRQLNEHNYIDGFDLELVPAYTANSPEIATLKIGELVHEKTDCQNKQPLLAVIGPETSEEAISTSTVLSSLPDEYRTPQVLFSTTTTLLTNKSTNNILRVTQSEYTLIKAMIKVLEKLEWNMVAVIYYDNANGHHVFHLFKDAAKERDICIPRTYKMDVNSRYKQYMTVVEDVINQNINGIIVLGRDSHIRDFFEAMDSANSNKTLNMPAVLLSEGPLTSDTVLEKDGVPFVSAKGVLFMSPPVKHLIEFQDYWMHLFENKESLKNYSLANPYLLKVREKVFNCQNITDFEDSCISSLSDSQKYMLNFTHIPYAVHTAFAIAKSLKVICELIPEECSSLSLSRIRETLLNIDIDYDDFIQMGIGIESWEHESVQYEDGEPYAKEYYISNYRQCADDTTGFCLINIGKYTTKPSEELSFDVLTFRDYKDGSEVSWEDRRIANCPVGFSCESCLPKDLSQHVLYEPGDYVLMAAMPIHNMGTDPFNCGGIRSSIGLDLALAIQWALKDINEKDHYFSRQGKTIGMLLFDTCNDPLVIQEKLLDFYKRGQTLNGVHLKDKILGFIGTLGSGPTIAAADILNKLNLVHLGCVSTSSLLGDKFTYPNFLRMSSPLDKAVDLMFEIARQLKANTIQVIYTEGGFGENGRDLTLQSAFKNRICVANHISVPEYSDDCFARIFDELLENKESRLVFVFLRSHIAPIFAKCYQNSKIKKDQFRLITSHAWGNRPENIKDNLKLEGTITLAQEMKMQWAAYKDFLSKIRPQPHETHNAFLVSYFEAVFGCYFPWSYNKTYPTKCIDEYKLGWVSTVDSWTPYVVRSAQAFVQGAANAFENLCSHNNNGQTLCDGYTQNPASVRNYIKNVKLDVNFDNIDDYVFDENGDGRAGYKIYISRMTDSDTLEYDKVYDKELSLELNLESEHVTSMISEDALCSCLNIPCTKICTNSQTALYVVSGLFSAFFLAVCVFVLRRYCLHQGLYKDDSSVDYLDPCSSEPTTSTQQHYITTAENYLFDHDIHADSCSNCYINNGASPDVGPCPCSQQGVDRTVSATSVEVCVDSDASDVKNKNNPMYQLSDVAFN